MNHFDAKTSEWADIGIIVTSRTKQLALIAKWISVELENRAALRDFWDRENARKKQAKA